MTNKDMILNFLLFKEIKKRQRETQTGKQTQKIQLWKIIISKMKKRQQPRHTNDKCRKSLQKRKKNGNCRRQTHFSRFSLFVSLKIKRHSKKRRFLLSIFNQSLTIASCFLLLPIFIISFCAFDFVGRLLSLVVLGVVVSVARLFSYCTLFLKPQSLCAYVNVL